MHSAGNGIYKICKNHTRLWVIPLLQLYQYVELKIISGPQPDCEGLSLDRAKKVPKKYGNNIPNYNSGQMNCQGFCGD
jgi:hypothetical protein